MWSKRKTSDSQEFPHRIDLIRYFVQRVHDRRDCGAWAHIELVEPEGWFTMRRFIEVAFDESDTLVLNLGFKTELISGVPEILRNWVQESKFTWSVPLADLTVLVDWIDKCFGVVCSDTPNRKLTGWTEGEVG